MLPRCSGPQSSSRKVGRDPSGCQPVLSPHFPAGRKMRVYQREEVPGSPEAHAVFLQPGQAAEQALSTEEPRPLELSGPTRVGLEGPERRRFSASELMTRLHSSLRLGRNSAARALTPGSGTGTAREGISSSPLALRAAQSQMQGGARPTHWTPETGCWSVGVWHPSVQGHSWGHPPSALALSRESIWKGVARCRDEDGQGGDGSPCRPKRRPWQLSRVQVPPPTWGSGLRRGRRQRALMFSLS